MLLRILMLAAASSVAAFAAAEERFCFERPLMGTRFIVICHADERIAAEKASDAAFRVAENLNATASDYLPESELSQLSSKPTGHPITLSPLLLALLDHSQQIARTTDGAFDPTLGPLTKLWRESRDHRRLPDSATLRSAQARSDWRHFTLDSGSSTITLHHENMAFDLGGMAKGYAADLMLRSLAENGINKAIVIAGGDIRLGDPPPGREGWRVALQTFDRTRPDEVITLSNVAVSTSGDLYQSVEIDGVRYSHILDPRTGLGLTRRLAAIVIADEAKISDPLSTAACVLGPDAHERLHGFPGLRELKLRVPGQSIDPIFQTHSSDP